MVSAAVTSIPVRRGVAHAAVGENGDSAGGGMGTDAFDAHEVAATVLRPRARSVGTARRRLGAAASRITSTERAEPAERESRECNGVPDHAS